MLAVVALGACGDDARVCAVPVAALSADAETCVPGCGADDDAPRCEGTCGPQLEFEWFVELPGPANCSREPVIAADVPGYVVVGGGRERAPDTLFAITAVSPGGCVLWDDVEAEVPGEVPADSLVLGLGGAADVGYYAVGRSKRLVEDPFDWIEQVWIRRYTPDGDVAWTRRERSDAAQQASAVVVLASGDALVVGGGYPYGATRGWLRRYSADGEQRQDLLELGDGPFTYINDVVRSDAGQVWLSFWESDGYYSRPWLARLDDAYAIVWLETSPGENSGGGRLALAGESPVMIAYPDPYGPEQVSRWTTDGGLEWTRGLRTSPSLVAGRATVTNDGGVVIAGVLDELKDAMPVAVVLDADGAVVTIQRIPGASGAATDVARAPDGSLYFSGLITRFDPADPNAIDTSPTCSAWVARARAP